MTKWKRDRAAPWLVVDDVGTVMAECDNPDQSAAIIREHNAHAALLAACEGALRIESLWLPGDVVLAEHDEEARALFAMRNALIQVTTLAEATP